ncbi:MAG: hypothetical protein ACLVJK_11345 [Alistipes putredinis]
MLEHLETCPACAEFYRQTKAAFNTVAPRVEVQAPAGLKARILKTAAQAENTPATARTTAPARPRQLWLRPLSATLSAAALIALVLLVLRSRRPLPGPRAQDVSSAMLPLKLDKSRSFRLRNECPHSSPGKFQLHRCRSPLCSPPYVGGTGFRPLAAGKSRTDRPERRGTDPDVES